MGGGGQSWGEKRESYFKIFGDVKTLKLTLDILQVADEEQKKDLRTKIILLERAFLNFLKVEFQKKVLEPPI